MKNIKGIKDTCSTTKRIGSYMGDNVQVFYDKEDNEVFGIYHTLNEWTEFRNNPDIIEVTTYYEPATMKQIRAALEQVIK